MRTVLVMSGSLIISLGLTIWIKKTAYPEFKMIGAYDIVMSSIDFGSDVLFVIEAYENNAKALAIVSTVLLVLSCVVSFGCCLAILLDQSRNDAGSFDFERVAKSPGSYGALVVLSATDIELVKLFPWKNASDLHGPWEVN